MIVSDFIAPSWNSSVTTILPTGRSKQGMGGLEGLTTQASVRSGATSGAKALMR